MWFLQIVRSFFFTLDSTLFNFIPQVYDLLIAISRTSILTQGQIKQFADRIQLFLGVFMLFKVTFSLITYIVMPDEFSDKSKGFGKLWQNIIISLVLLILTPYAFNMAYEFQAMILEDNTLAVLVFGDSGDNENYISTAGEKISYTIIEPMFSPNVSVGDLFECSSMVVTNESGVRKFNENCKAVLLDYYQNGDSDNKSANNIFVNNYAAGVEHSNLGLFFRLEMAKATVAGNKNGGNEAFLIDYNIPVTTVVAVIVLLLLVTFCMDVALRSIKLSFLQLISPIPIIGYIDPKGKDGIFKKWYQMCFSTYLSLFVRLLALYLGIYIISKVNSMTDIITGASVTNGFVKIFIIIGVLMFAKQLPKILEGLGIKLDGDGKFQLNPFKKFEDEALGGKAITGAAAGVAVGGLGNAVNALQENKGLRKLKAIPALLTGAGRGLTHGLIENKGFKDQAKRQAEMNQKIRGARLEGTTMGGRILDSAASYIGAETPSEKFDRMSKSAEAELQFNQANLDYAKNVRNSILDDLKNKSSDELRDKYGAYSRWVTEQRNVRTAEDNLNQLRQNPTATAAQIAAARDALAEAEEKAVENIMDSGQENGLMAGERAKFNTRVQNNAEFAKRAGITELNSPAAYYNLFDNPSSGVKGVKGKSQGKVTALEQDVYQYKNSSKASKYQADKTYNEATKLK